MKRKCLLVISILVILISLTGCGMKTPKKKVESLLMSYQNNNDNIMSELNDYLTTLNISNDNIENYRKVYTKQYQDLKYEIKDEMIDGDNATVTAQIEVYDYYKTENDINNYLSANADEFATDGVYDTTKAMKYRIEELLKSKDRVTYTLNFTLTKINNEWVISNLTNEDLEKIHGNYAH